MVTCWGYGKKKMRRGYSVMELLVVLGVIAVIAPPLFMLSKSYEKRRAAASANKRVEVLASVIKANFEEGVKYSENNGCYGWNDSACSGISLTPEQGANNKIIVFRTPTPNLIKRLSSVGCFVAPGSGGGGGATVFNVECPDRHGKKLKMVVSNGHRHGSDYYAPYKSTPFTLTIDDDARTFHRVITIDRTTDLYKGATREKLVTLSNAIKRFVREIRIRELNNDCSDGGTAENPPGGLGSWDDPLVPWSWKLVSSKPYTVCSGSQTSDGCGCSNFSSSSIWPTSASYCRIDRKAEWNLVLGNLKLGSRYRTDGFGNKLTMVPTADSNGNPTTCPPPVPRPGYPEHSTLGKVRIGVYDSGARIWRVYLDVYTD